MDPKHWLDKKPSAIRDWLGMAFLCIACVIVLSQLGALLAQAGALLRLAAPFGWAAVLAYVLDTLVRPLHRFLFRGRPGLRWAAILAAYVLAGLAVFLLVWLVVPQVVASVTAFFRGLPDSVAALQRTLAGLEARYGVSLKPLIEALEDYEQWMASLSATLSGGVPGLVNGEAPAAVPDGEGGVSSYVSFELLQRWTFPAEYRLENGRMTVEMQEFYVDEALKTFNKTALIQLAAYDSPEGDGRHVIDAGTALALYGAAPAEEPDGEGWVLAGDESGEPHYLRAAFPGAVENAAGEWTAAADAIAGLELYG